MTKAEEAALKAYPKEEGKVWSSAFGMFEFDKTAPERTAYQKGYEQAEKDIFDRIEKYLSNRNPTDYATVGWILKNIEEYKKKIMEEE